MSGRFLSSFPPYSDCRPVVGKLLAGQWPRPANRIETDRPRHCYGRKAIRAFDRRDRPFRLLLLLRLLRRRR